MTYQFYLQHSNPFIIISNFIRSAIVFLVMSNCYSSEGYVGLTSGYDSTNFHKTLNIRSIAGAEKYYKNDNLNGNGGIISMLIGYKKLIQRFNIAGEFSYKYNFLTYHGFVNDHYNVEELSEGFFTIRQVYILSLLPGYFLAPQVQLYGRLGCDYSLFKYSEHKVTNNGPNGLSEFKWLPGLRWGIGVAIELVNKWVLRLEVNRINYHTYQDKNYKLAPNVNRTIKLTPLSNQMEIGLLYHF